MGSRVGSRRQVVTLLWRKPRRWFESSPSAIFMKILKDNIYQEDNLYQNAQWIGKELSCSECGTRFELELRDKILIRFLDEGGGPYPSSIRCPNCNWEVFI
jgi:DNA-directed RNA polymerase subunit RPC12/RpoP